MQVPGCLLDEFSEHPTWWPRSQSARCGLAEVKEFKEADGFVGRENELHEMAERVCEQCEQCAHECDIFVVPVPNGETGSSSRMNPLVNAVCALLQTSGRTVTVAEVTRDVALDVPAKYRAAGSPDDDAIQAQQEAETMTLVTQPPPSAVVVVVDDFSATGITFAAVRHLLADVGVADTRISYVALHCVPRSELAPVVASEPSETAVVRRRLFRGPSSPQPKEQDEAMVDAAPSTSRTASADSTLAQHCLQRMYGKDFDRSGCTRSVFEGTVQAGCNVEETLSEFQKYYVRGDIINDINNTNMCNRSVFQHNGAGKDLRELDPGGALWKMCKDKAGLYLIQARAVTVPTGFATIELSKELLGALNKTGFTLESCVGDCGARDGGKSLSKSLWARLKQYVYDATTRQNKGKRICQAAKILLGVGFEVEWDMVPVMSFDLGAVTEETCTAFECILDCITHSGPTPGNLGQAMQAERGRVGGASPVFLKKPFPLVDVSLIES